MCKWKSNKMWKLHLTQSDRTVALWLPKIVKVLDNFRNIYILNCNIKFTNIYEWFIIAIIIIVIVMIYTAHINPLDFHGNANQKCFLFAFECFVNHISNLFAEFISKLMESLVRLTMGACHLLHMLSPIKDRTISF